MGPRDHLALVHDHAADRHFPGRHRGAGFFEGEVHE